MKAIMGQCCFLDPIDIHCMEKDYFLDELSFLTQWILTRGAGKINWTKIIIYN